MEETRPPSYRALTVYDVSGVPELVTVSSLSPTGSSTSDSGSSSEWFYDPSPEKYAEDLESWLIKSNMRPHARRVPARRGQTVPAIVSVSRPPLSTEKRPPPNITNPSLRNALYLFKSSTTGTNSMSLVPAVDNDDSQAQYSVTVSMNCFMPSSFITKIYHMRNLIGEFELGIMNNAIASKVKVGGLNHVISDILSKSGGRISGSWFWTPLGISKEYCLKWDYSTRPCMCYSTVGEKGILAKFTSPYGLNDTNGPPILEVTPAGQDQNLFEHILISLLIIERKRLTPDRENNLKPLFN